MAQNKEDPSATKESTTIEESPTPSDGHTNDGYALDAAAVQDHMLIKTTKDGRTIL